MPRLRKWSHQLFIPKVYPSSVNFGPHWFLAETGDNTSFFYKTEKESEASIYIGAIKGIRLLLLLHCKTEDATVIMSDDLKQLSSKKQFLP